MMNELSDCLKKRGIMSTAATELEMMVLDWLANMLKLPEDFLSEDLMHAFSSLPKDLNFIQHSIHLGWKLDKREKPIIIDPGLYSLNKSEIWWVIKQRNLPTTFKLYTVSMESSSK
ncbi:hypothetical protein DITRI_Ditri14bG0093300 [Diplodiscus trichospermus]